MKDGASLIPADTGIGQTLILAMPSGGDPAAFRRRVCVMAHRAWGKGSYRTAVEAGAVRLTRIEPDAAPPPAPPPILPQHTPSDAEAQRKPLTREEAASWLDPYVPGGMTASQLRGHAVRGTGPRHFRFGKAAVYFPEDLATWLRERLRPAGTRGTRAA